jgi:hypothetical protein
MKSTILRRIERRMGQHRIVELSRHCDFLRTDANPERPFESWAFRAAGSERRSVPMNGERCWRAPWPRAVTNPQPQ